MGQNNLLGTKFNFIELKYMDIVLKCKIKKKYDNLSANYEKERYDDRILSIQQKL